MAADVASVNAVAARALTFLRAHPMPYPSVGWTAARVNAERWT